MPIIRRVIHFVWAGGERIMPPESIKVVSDWAKANINFEVWLWVDNTTWPYQNKTIIQNYKKRFLKESISLVYEENFPEDAQQQVNKTHAPIIIKDINVAELRDEYVAYELDKLRPNYGASSDLLRYVILYKYGGAYFDSDVAHHDDFSLETICFDERAGHRLYIDHLSQEPAPQVPVEPKKTLIDFPKPSGDDYELSLKKYAEKQADYAKKFTAYAEELSNYVNEQSVYLSKLKDFSIDSVGNDTLICTQDNPLMLEILQQAQENYSTAKGDIRKTVSLAHGSRYVRDITIERTGPLVVSDTIKKFNCKTKADKVVVYLSEVKKVQVLPVRKIDYELTKPLSNTLNWMGPKLIEHKNKPKKAVKTVKNTILFEAEKFAILRLDDHISDLSQSCQIEPNMALKHLLKALTDSEIDFKKIVFGQYTFRYPELLGFYQTRNIPTLLDDQSGLNVRLALLYETNFLFFADTYEKLKQKKIESAKYLNSKIRIYCRHSLRAGISFITRLVENLSVFTPSEARAICEYLIAPKENNGILDICGWFNDDLKVFRNREIIALLEQVQSFYQGLTVEDKSTSSSCRPCY